MAQRKAKANEISVKEFLDRLTDDVQRSESYALVDMLQAATRVEPRLWQGRIVGFDSYHYADPNGRQGDWLLVGFSPRKGTLSLYVLGGWDHDADLLSKLGKYKLGDGSLLHIKKLADVDLQVLKQLINESVARAKKLSQNED